MTPADARDFERRWGAPGPAPDAAWRCCYRCGDWWPDEGRCWCRPHRICRACKDDEKRGIWPMSRAWHRKNRWDEHGRLRRRCCTCRRWHPLTDYYRYRPHARHPHGAVAAECAGCTKRRVTRGLTIPQYRRRFAA